MPPRASALVLALLFAAAATAPSAARDAPGQAAAPSSRNARAGDAGTSVTPAARRATANGDPAQRQRKLRSEQQRLQGRLSKAKQQLAAAEASHSEATDALKESEAAISAANRRLRQLAADRRQVERQMSALRERSRRIAARQGIEERQLAEVLRAQYALAQSPPWHRLLDGEAPQQQEQDLAYLAYVARAGNAAVGELRERRAELAALEAESRDKQAELAAIARAEDDSRRQLVRQQAARRQTLDRLARQIGSQRRSLATLERDEKRLSSLIDELTRVLAEQARREQAARARREAARSAPAPSPAGKGAAEPADLDDTRFARLRGKLPLPVDGQITARFGTARRTEAGVDAPTWKGVFIRAAEGTEVRAVAAGRVAFADWLRGFGNLLIVDHGEGFLSVYGNNETLLASLGERVDAGEVIATVGNTGGNPEAGLYFELRFQGRPFDPLRWAAAR